MWGKARELRNVWRERRARRVEAQGGTEGGREGGMGGRPYSTFHETRVAATVLSDP